MRFKQSSFYAGNSASIFGRQAGISGNLILVLLTVISALVAGWYALYARQNADPSAVAAYANDTPEQRAARINELVALVAAQPRMVQQAISPVESLGYSSLIPTLQSRGALVGQRVDDGLRHGFAGVVEVQGADTVLRLKITALPRDACVALLQRQPWDRVGGMLVTEVSVGLSKASGNPASDCGENDNTISVQMKRYAGR